MKDIKQEVKKILGMLLILNTKDGKIKSDDLVKIMEKIEKKHGLDIERMASKLNRKDKGEINV